jgi:hypothetical protein
MWHRDRLIDDDLIAARSLTIVQRIINQFINIRKKVLHETKTLKDVKKNKKKIYSKMEYLNTEGSHTFIVSRYLNVQMCNLPFLESGFSLDLYMRTFVWEPSVFKDSISNITHSLTSNTRTHQRYKYTVIKHKLPNGAFIHSE